LRSFGRGLVEVGVDEPAGEVLDALDRAVDAGAVAVHVEHVHEHADQQRVAVGVGVADLLDLDDAAIGRRQHDALLGRHRARRVAEELHDEGQREPAQHREEPGQEERREHRDEEGDRDEGPALLGEDRVGVIHGREG
jgi:hypothetical protein